MKKIILIMIAVSQGAVLSADHHTENEWDANFFNPGVRAAFLYDEEKWDFLSRLEVDFPGSPEILPAFSAGGYYRLHRNVKAGAFYIMQDNRGLEHILSADVTPRFLVPAVSGANLVASVKNRYTFNFTTEGQSYFLLPGMSWYIMKNRQPVVNLFGGYGLYSSLEFSEGILTDQGPWVNIMYHLNSRLKLELQGEYLIEGESLSVKGGVIYRVSPRGN